MFAPTAFAAGGTAELINYQNLDHNIRLTALRSGNHDDSGVNDYYFEVKIYGLQSTQEERKLEFAKRKKILVEGGRFGAIQIPVLSHWEKPEKAPEITMKGEIFRELAAKAMKQFKVVESEIAILIEVELYEANKRFGLIGEDRHIGKTSYYLIPETFPHRPVTKDVSLSITDDLGLSATLGVLFKLTAANSQGNGAASSTGG
jgi:hypothetical protein